MSMNTSQVFEETEYTKTDGTPAVGKTKQKIKLGSAYVNTDSPEKLNFVAADFPACVLYFDRNSIVDDGGADFIDQANGLVFRNPHDDYVELNSDGITFNAVRGAAAGERYDLVTASGSMPALSTNHALYLLVAKRNSTGGDGFMEIGDTDTGVGALINTKGGLNTQAYLTYDGSDYLGSTSTRSALTDVDGSVIASAVTIHREAATEATILRDYQIDSSDTISIIEGAVTGTTINWNTQDLAAYANYCRFDNGNSYYLGAAFHVADARMLAEPIIRTALLWMRNNPGHLWPGFKNFASV